MLWAAQDLGWQIFYMEPQHLYAEQGVAMGLMAPLSVMRDAHHFYELDEQHVLPLGDLDVILMRKDPPFDSQFLHTTYLLSQAEDAGALLLISLKACATATKNYLQHNSQNVVQRYWSPVMPRYLKPSTHAMAMSFSNL